MVMVGNFHQLYETRVFRASLEVFHVFGRSGSCIKVSIGSEVCGELGRFAGKIERGSVF